MLTRTVFAFFGKEFKAVFADIERDMAKQRAELAARPKDAPLDLAATGT